MKGWIKLHRKSLESSVFQSPNLWQVWSYCLLRVNHQEAKFLWNGAETILGAGQFITGRLKGSQECNMNPSTFWKQIKQLEKINNISVKSNNKNSVITIINWASYQGDTENRDNQMTTKEQPNDTNKNNKNVKNIKKAKNLYSIENIPLNLNGQLFYQGKYFYVDMSFKNELLEKFADKNLNDDVLLSEFYKMECWLEEKGAKKNYKLFIINWISRLKPQQQTIQTMTFNYSNNGKANEQSRN